MAINIYSTDKNGFNTLSNVFNGPVKIKLHGSDKEDIFHSVEHLYNYRKAVFFDKRALAEEIRHAKTGWDAIRLANTISVNHNSDEYRWWDTCNEGVLEEYMRSAFEQNPKQVELLLKTGNEELTHISPKGLNLGKWAKVFPEILTKIREEYQKK